MKDLRLGCHFHPDRESVALAPQHTGGDIDVPASWVPVCAEDLAGWYDDVDEDERLPTIPRDGVLLTVEQADALRAALEHRVNNEPVDEDVADAYDALVTGLRNLR